jgi:hypothetical protein
MGRKSHNDELLTALGLDEPDTGDVTPQLRALVDRMRAEAARTVADPSAHISAAALAAREAIAETPAIRRVARTPVLRGRFGQAIARTVGAVTLLSAGILGVVSSGVLNPGAVVADGPNVVGEQLPAIQPGVIAVPEAADGYVRLLDQLNAIAAEFEGVDRVYAMQAGRQVQVVVDPNVVGDRDEILALAQDIIARLQADLGEPVTVQVDATGRLTAATQ